MAMSLMIEWEEMKIYNTCFYLLFKKQSAERIAQSGAGKYFLDTCFYLLFLFQ
jgi:hypothetical protein